MLNYSSIIVAKTMPDRCFVPNCNAGFPGFKSDTKVAFFKPPKDSELLKKWNQAIPRQDSDLKMSSRVCSSHFEDDDVLKGRWLEGKDGKQIFYSWNNWILKDGGIPIIFPGI